MRSRVIRNTFWIALMGILVIALGEESCMALQAQHRQGPSNDVVSEVPEESLAQQSQTFSVRPPLAYIHVARGAWVTVFQKGRNVEVSSKKARSLLLESDLFNQDFEPSREDLPFCYLLWYAPSRKMAEAQTTFQPWTVNPGNLFDFSAGQTRVVTMRVISSAGQQGSLVCLKAQDQSKAFLPDEIRAIVGDHLSLGEYGEGRSLIFLPLKPPQESSFD